MAPLNQLSVLAFAGAALAVPHFEPFHKRHAHAHPAAPPAYGDSAPPAYGTSSSAGAVSSSAPGGYGSSAAAASSSGWGSYGSSGSAVVSSGYAGPTGGYGSSGHAHPTGGYGWGSTGTGYSVKPTGYSGSASYSTCTETSTLIYRSTTEYSTYYVTHTVYPESSASAGSGSGGAGGYPGASSPAQSGPGGYPGASGSAASPAGSGSAGGYPSGGEGSGSGSGEGCAPEVTVTTTEKSTVYVTAGPSSPASPAGGAPSGGYPGSWEPAPSASSAGADSSSASPTYPATWEPAPSASGSAEDFPGCWRLCFKQNHIESQSALCGNDAVSKCIHDNCSNKQDKAYWDWYDNFCAASSSSSPAASSPATSSAPAYSSPAASSATATSSGWSAPSSGSGSSPSSYSAPSPSASAPSGGYGGASGYSGKRGLAYNDAGLTSMFENSPVVGWAYNWEPDSKGLPSSIPYIPCLHSDDSMWTDIWDQAAQSAIDNGGKWLFGMNEPDISTQANMSPEAAATFWKQWMEPYAGKIGLVAPAVTSGVGPDIGAGWLTQFMGNCSDCTIDAVGQHWYNSNGNDVQSFKDTINTAAGFGKPVWVNEFGAIGSDSEISSFLEEVMSWMDSNDDVLGYSYYMVSDGLLCDGDSPSSYGSTYMDYQS